MNQQVSDHFYTYLMNYKPCNIRIVPQTKLKSEIQQISKSSIEAFHDMMLEELKTEVKERSAEWAAVTDEIGASLLFDIYVRWCASNKVNVARRRKPTEFCGYRLSCAQL